MLDIFHLQYQKGNLSNNIKKYLPITGHVQIAQVPDRFILIQNWISCTKFQSYNQLRSGNIKNIFSWNSTVQNWGQVGCGVYNFWYQNYLDFIKKVYELQGSCCIFWSDIVKIWGCFLNMENWKFVQPKKSQFWINLIRHEPDSLGEKNYKYVLDLLQSYDKEWIGLEYIPKSDTNGGLKWIENFGFHLWFFKRLDLSTCNFQLENTNLLQLNWSQILCYRYVYYFLYFSLL